MRVLLVLVGVFLLTRAGTAVAVCGDGVPEPPGEQCDDGNTADGDCCSGACQFEGVGSPCSDPNPCTTDTCDGLGECTHAAGNAGAPCRAAAGPCDVAESCTGLDTSCPLDAKSTAPCRPSAGDCDIAETCDGVADGCPSDTLLPASVECRPALGDCDVPESCTGNDPACPLDGKSTATCRSAAGDCDLPESCNGVGDDCPPDLFVPASVVCRHASDQCDADESCTGFTSVCPPDAPAPDDTACNDGDACTQTASCQGGTCTGANPVVCTPLDQCHVAGTCNSATGVCSNPARADNAPCDDANACTTADSCQDAQCRGLTVAGCCLIDEECDDGVACTADQCASHSCRHAALDARCGAPASCAQLACVPEESSADTSGCVVRTTDEGSYCTEDDDPCTIDACRTGTCRHEPDGSGARCVLLAAPYNTTLELLARAQDLETALQTAVAAGCPRGAPLACGVAPGEESTRLISLLESTQGDLGTASLALAGRLAGPASPSTPRDPLERARLAFGLLAGTPADLRGFLATLAVARQRRVVTPGFARARRADGRRLLRGTRKLRRQLRRLLIRRQSFAR